MRCCWLLLCVLFISCWNAHAGNSALCFLTRTPAPETLRFAQQLADDGISYGLDVFMVIDDPGFNTSNVTISPNLHLLNVSEAACFANGYQNTISLFKNWRKVTAWDKALLYFARWNRTYSFVWLVEDDVFIGTPRIFRSLHELYAYDNDLVLPANMVNPSGDTSTWLWSMATDKLVIPWSSSMVNVVGLSRRLLNATDDFVRWLGEVPFHEFFFNTLALQLRLSVVTPLELTTIVYGKAHSVQDMVKRPNNLWHPLKSFLVHQQYHFHWGNRTLLSNSSRNFTDVDTFCRSGADRNTTEEHLTNLLNKFELHKSEFSPDDRRSLRRNFTGLAERCRSQNASNETIALAMKLADVAFKLPEPLMKELVASKSARHITLEQALEANRKAALNESSNSSRLVELREQRKALVTNLTEEIKREMQAEQDPHRTEPSTSSSTTRHSLETNDTRSSTASTSPTTTAIKTTAMATTTTLTTTSSPTTASSTMKTAPKRAYVSYVLKEQIEDRNSQAMEDNIKIFFLIIFMLAVLFVLLQLQVFQSHKHFIFILVFVLFLLFWCIS